MVGDLFDDAVDIEPGSITALLGLSGMSREASRLYWGYPEKLIQLINSIRIAIREIITNPHPSIHFGKLSAGISAPLYRDSFDRLISNDRLK